MKIKLELPDGIETIYFVFVRDTADAFSTGSAELHGVKDDTLYKFTIESLTKADEYG